MSRVALHISIRQLRRSLDCDLLEPTCYQAFSEAVVMAWAGGFVARPVWALRGLLGGIQAVLLDNPCLQVGFAGR